MKKSILVLVTTIGMAAMLCVGCEGRKDTRTSVNEANSTTQISSTTENTQKQETAYSETSTTQDTRAEERRLYNLAKKMYMSGEWDGKETFLEGHTIKLAENKGYILLDGFCPDQTNLDIPESEYPLTSNSLVNFAYVPGEGTYVVLDHKLVKYLRGTRIDLPGEELSWKGFYSVEELASAHPTSSLLYSHPKLSYNKKDGKLYLLSGDDSCTISSCSNYVYCFNDLGVSEIEYLGKAYFPEKPEDVDITTLSFEY